MDIEELGRKIIGLGIEVHRYLGPGLLEGIYERCLFEEFNLNGLNCKRQVPLNVRYKGVDMGVGYSMDLVVEDSIVLELKSVEKLNDLHKAQILTYLKLSEIKVGYLMNFNSVRLVDDLRKFNL